jgi:hypothetical protein
MDLDESIFVSINQSPFVDKCYLLYTIKSTSARIKGVYFYLNWVVSRWCPGKICKNLYLFFSFWGVYKRTTLEICPRPELLCFQHQEKKELPCHISQDTSYLSSPLVLMLHPIAHLFCYTLELLSPHSQDTLYSTKIHTALLTLFYDTFCAYYSSFSY